MDDVKTCDQLGTFKEKKSVNYIDGQALNTKYSTFTNPPLCITVALGFDSFVVMRHSYGEERQDFACYFCSDFNAPTDNSSSRTLDQQCTVSRPGASSIAACLSVELLVSLSQHPDYFAAAHSSYDEGPNSESSSCMGATPQIIRGSLSNFRLQNLHVEPCRNCICCSAKIIEAYQENPSKFLHRVIKNGEILEEISGLKDVSNAALDSIKDVMYFDDEIDTAIDETASTSQNA